MKKSLNVVLTIILLVVLLGGAYYAYTRYADNRRMVPPTEPSFTPQISAQTTGDSPAMASETPAQTSNLPKEIDFTLNTLDGRTVTLSDYVGKKAVVLNFWATWCPPCRAELPDFNEQAAALGEDKVVFLMVDLTDGSRETPEIVSKFIADNKFTFKNILLDTDLSATSSYSVNGIPSTFFINKDGYIVRQYEGAIDANTLKDGIELALQ